MKKPFTRGEKLLFLSPLLFLIIAGAAWLQRNGVPETLTVAGATDISSLDFSPDGRRLLVGFHKGPKVLPSGRIYDVKSRSRLSELQAAPLLADIPTHPTRDPANRFFSWSSDGKSIVASSSAEVAIWDVKSGIIQANYPHPPTRKYMHLGNLRFSPDGKTLIGEGVPPAVYDVMTGRQLNRSEGAISDVAQVELSENGQWLARFFLRKFHFDVVDAKTKRTLWKPQLYGDFGFRWGGDVLCIQDGARGEPRRILLWNGKTRQQMPSPPPPSGAEINNAHGWPKLNPRHKTLAYFLTLFPFRTETYKSEIIVWDFGANQVLWRRKFDDSLANLLWSPDGNWLSVMFDTPMVNKRLQVFDRTGTLRYERKNVLQASWSPDSKQLAVAVIKKPIWSSQLTNQIEFHHFDAIKIQR